MYTYAYVYTCLHIPIQTHQNAGVLPITSRWNYGYIVINVFTFVYIPINTINIHLSNSSQDCTKTIPLAATSHPPIHHKIWMCIYIHILIHTHTHMCLCVCVWMSMDANSVKIALKLYPQQRFHTLLFIITYECAYVHKYTPSYTHTHKSENSRDCTNTKPPAATSHPPIHLSIHMCTRMHTLIHTHAQPEAIPVKIALELYPQQRSSTLLFLYTPPLRLLSVSPALGPGAPPPPPPPPPPRTFSTPSFPYRISSFLSDDWSISFILFPWCFYLSAEG